jgi:hypothetical protein
VNRSTKAGASTPAIPSHPGPTGGRCCEPLNEGRGVDPGNPRGRWRGCPSTGDRALNEGRGVDPGNPCSASATFTKFNIARSTKAGASTPAIPDHQPPSRPGEDHAQRRPGRRPRQSLTTRRRGAWPTSGPLNEGRGVDPGNPRGRWRGCPSTGDRALNEGRGVDPGNPGSPTSEPPWRRSRSTKAGASTPAIPHDEAKGRVADVRAAQRRPGRRPRQSPLDHRKRSRAAKSQLTRARLNAVSVR